MAISTSITSSSAGLLLWILFMSGLSLPERVGFLLLAIHWRLGGLFDERRMFFLYKKSGRILSAAGAVISDSENEIDAELLLECLFGILQPGQEGGTLYAEAVGDGLVRQSGLPESADLDGFRHEFR